MLVRETRDRWASMAVNPTAHSLPTSDHQAGAYGLAISDACRGLDAYDASMRAVVAALRAGAPEDVETALCIGEAALRGLFLPAAPSAPAPDYAAPAERVAA